ncbi:CYTH domain-containing protein [Polaribacter aestuariivivens]|uniref:CYTH domain-containing protein n=1 Tax=Polaribacter aestuariivivens TaxID=2304626 RepID=A0A5S3N5L8_9FLAO|nr:CYTH domain-containing protein [Polaribacter aestuariivivens]TMM30573.1 CYTH domain-containing protein [Polaribacter aestuariivivens]
MSLEIERKFLVKNDNYKKESFHKTYIKQGYLNSDEHRVVRVRITDKNGFITIKGKSNATGTTRFEWEKSITPIEANQLLLLSEPTLIEKTRFYVKKGKHVYEVDEFLGENLGLVIAEIELNSENENFEKPDWLGEEVTGNLKYYNSKISKHPFKNWS